MYKHSFLAEIFDKEITKEVVSRKNISNAFEDDFGIAPIIPEKQKEIDFIPSEKSENTEKKVKYLNKREKLFCKCGNAFEFKLQQTQTKIYKEEDDLDQSNSYYNRDRDGRHYKTEQGFEPVTCSGCNTVYSNYENLKCIKGHSDVYGNSFFSKFLCFENEKSITLYNFSKYVIIGLKKKNIIYKEVKTFLSYNKQKKCFFLSKGHLKHFGFIRIPLRRMHEHIESFLFNFVQVTIKNLSEEERNIHAIKPLEEFLEKIKSLINKNDVKKIGDIMFQKEKDIKEMYFSKISHEDLIKNSGNLWYMEQVSFICEQIKVFSTVLVLPSLSTVIFIKGYPFMFNMISHHMVPGLSAMQKSNPTSPAKILREIIVLKLKSDNLFYKRLSKYRKVGQLEIKWDESEKDTTTKKKIPTYLVKQSKYIQGTPALSKEEIENIKIPKSILKKIDHVESFISIIYQSLNLNKVFGLGEIYKLFENHNYNATIAALSHLLNRYGDIEVASPGNFFKFVKHNIKIIESISKNKTNIRSDYYFDCIRMSAQIGVDMKSIFDCKTIDEIIPLHNRLSVQMKQIRLAIHDAALRKHAVEFIHLNTTINNIEFILLENSKAFIKESEEMNHCVSSYTESVARGTSLIFKITDLSTGDRATVSYRRDKITPYSEDIELLFTEWNFEQAKSKHNRKITNKIVEAILKFSKEFVKAKISERHKTNGDLTIIKPVTAPIGVAGFPTIG